MDGLDNLKSILCGFNALADQHSDAFTAAAKSGDADAMQMALDGIVEAHRLKEDYTQSLVRRIAVASKRPPKPPMPS
jgi:hypothetical protein